MQQEAMAIKQEHLETIRQHLLPGEDLHAAVDCMGVPTLFVGITDARVILCTKEKTILSIRYGRIVSISYDPGGLMANDKIRLYLPDEKKIELAPARQDSLLPAYRAVMAGFLGKPFSPAASTDSI